MTIANDQTVLMSQGFDIASRNYLWFITNVWSIFGTIPKFIVWACRCYSCWVCSCLPRAVVDWAASWAQRATAASRASFARPHSYLPARPSSVPTPWPRVSDRETRSQQRWNLRDRAGTALPEWRLKGPGCGLAIRVYGQLSSWWSEGSSRTATPTKQAPRASLRDLQITYRVSGETSVPWSIESNNRYFKHILVNNLHGYHTFLTDTRDMNKS